MKFLVEVNASGFLVDELMRLGHDVAPVAAKDPRMPDDDILRWATSEQRMIVTTDRDFEAMIWRAGKAHCGVLRLENPPRAERGILLEAVDGWLLFRIARGMSIPPLGDTRLVLPREMTVA